MQPGTNDRYTAVVLDLMRQSGQTRLSVTGTSMLPLLRPGDAVWLVAIDPAALHPGDLLLVRQQDVLLTHRLIAVGGEHWQTKGDNNRLADPPVTALHIEGRIVALERGGRSIDLCRRSWSIVSRLLAWLSWLEQRWQLLLPPEARRLANVGSAFVRLVIRASIVVAIRF